MKKALLAFVHGMLASTLVFVSAALLGGFKTEADVRPWRIESRFAQRISDASIRRSQMEKNPYRVDDAFLLAGLKLFEEGCAGCHGGYGKRSDWGLGISTRRYLSSVKRPCGVQKEKSSISFSMGFATAEWEDAAV